MFCGGHLLCALLRPANIDAAMIAGYSLLRNGKTIEGKVPRQGPYYVITKPGGGQNLVPPSMVAEVRYDSAAKAPSNRPDPFAAAGASSGKPASAPGGALVISLLGARSFSIAVRVDAEPVAAGATAGAVEA